MYTKYINEEGLTYILVYVDDILMISERRKNIEEVEILLKNKFNIKNLGKVNHYLGMEIFQDSS